ncbi:MAG: dipeptide epimerase [Polyangiaceae bacterium]
MGLASLRIEAVTISALSVPLKDPFVIASGRVDATRAVLIELEVSDLTTGQAWIGLGEAAALPPVTREDQPDIQKTLGRCAEDTWGRAVSIDEGFAGLHELLDEHLIEWPVSRAGLESAWLDAIAKSRALTVRELLGAELGARCRHLETDITIPILEPEYMGTLAKSWREQGFTCFKVKVGKDHDRDLRALEAIARQVPDARLRLDANAGFIAAEAISMVRAVEKLGLVLECFEQPCAADDLEGSAEVARTLDVPVVADESVKTIKDFRRVVQARAADGVNLKLAKSGGLLRALEIGREARKLGMSIMCGGMVETRLGMTAAASVAAALGGVEFADLDTAWLLREDPFVGGYSSDGPRYTLSDQPGFGIAKAAP